MRAGYFFLKSLTVTLFTLLALCAALWWWSGTASALAVLLAQAPHWLPNGQTLEAKDVSGNLQRGGHIGWLRWTHGALSVEAHDITLAWALRPLLNQHLHFSELRIATLHIDDQRAPSTSAAIPPVSLDLPLTLALPFSVAQLTHTGSFKLEASKLSGYYAFDSYTHSLNKGYIQISSGTYQLSGSLQAQAPMALNLQLEGQVRTTVPGRTQPLMVSATASLAGDIAATHAVLQLQAHLKPESVPGAMQASLSAQIAPWQAQPLAQAQAQWQHLNLAALWPQAPPTQLSGQANLTPSDPKSSVNPGNIAFTVQLANTRPAAQQLKLHLQGSWSAPQLTLRKVNLTTPEAQLTGQGVYNTQTQASQAHLALSLPGLTASVNGQLASQTGQGELTLQVQDAQRATHWLARWPLLSNLLKDQLVQGNASLQANWKGGWQQQGKQLHINAHLQAPQLTWPAPAGSAKDADPALQLRQLQADVNGSLAALTLRTQGQAHIGSRQLHWQAQAQGGQQAPGHWQGLFSQLTLRAQDHAYPGFWTLAPQPFTVDWLQTQSTQTLQLGASRAQLSGPLPGQALVSWQALRWSQQRRAASAHQPPARWQSRGQVSDLPLAWVDALSPKTLDDLGLSSTLLLNGSWDADHTDALHLSATLERSAGDVRLDTNANQPRALPALLHEARLNLNLAGEQLSANLRWRSERVGNALLAFSTELQASAQGWRWPDTAPLGGSLQMDLPPVEAWSMLAPPGWRLRGTLQANASLTGTHQQPHWQGTLQAHDLAVRSVADGIDFQQGSLRARLDGQKLTIEDFTLHGAGQDGGQLKITGLAQWLHTAQPNMPLAQHLHMALDAQVQALRLSSRADRLMTVSGQLNAQLADSTLRLSGQLGADQALITLPSESAPRLGEDVVVRPSVKIKPTSATPLPQRSAPLFTPEVHITLNLGSNFQVRGRGLATRLKGQLTLQASGTASPSLTGEVTTVRGTYQAYGQRLDIAQGVLRFVGPPDNPVLDILALRPKLSQRVGVQVQGTVQSPVVRLYADPDLPEAEKLSWLVLGRSASGSGGEAALLQQAALSLLGGSGQGPSASLTQALGLDELLFKSGNGDTASGASVTLGKRLGKDFYVAYESGLAGTMGVFTIFYDLSQRLSLRAQTGLQSAVDLIWTYRYD